MSKDTVTRDAIEDFVYTEAALIDDRRFEEWKNLFAADGQYMIVTPDTPDPENASPENTLFLVADDQTRLALRIKRIVDGNAHAEYPPSKTRHCVSNVRFSANGSGEVTVRANFITWRSRLDEIVCFPGHVVYRLVRGGDSFRIREKRCIIDTDTLRSQRTVAFLL
ncbi:MAG: aromatic-ring-hydroxylating dioxygenase subunit beta [Steroidobacteraceae bacterium]